MNTDKKLSIIKQLEEGLHWSKIIDKDSEFWENKEVVIEIVKRYGSALYYAPPKLQADKEVVMAAVGENASFADRQKEINKAIKYVSKTLCSDRDVITEAIKNYPQAIKYASSELQADKEIVMSAVSRYGAGLRFASDELRADKEVVIAALNGFPEAIIYTFPELQKDKDIVLAAISQGPRCLSYVTRELASDTDIREKVIEMLENKQVDFERLPYSLREKKDVIQTAIKINPNNYHFASWDMQLDEEIYKAIGKNKEMFRNICVGNKVYRCMSEQEYEALLNGEQISHKEHRNVGPRSLCFMPTVSLATEIRDPISGDMFRNQGIHAFQFLKSLPQPKELGEKYEVLVEFAIKNEDLLKQTTAPYAMGSLNANFMEYNTDGKSYSIDDLQPLRSVRLRFYEFLSEINPDELDSLFHRICSNEDMTIVQIKSIQNDREKLEAFFETYPESTTETIKRITLNRELQENPEEMVKAVKEDSNAISFVSQELLKDKDFAMLLVETNPDCFKKLPTVLKHDEDVAMTLVQIDGMYLRNLPYKLRTNKNVIIAAIENNEDAFFFVNKELQKTPEIIITAVKQNPEMIKYVSEERISHKEVLESIKIEKMVTEVSEGNLSKETASEQEL